LAKKAAARRRASKARRRSRKRRDRALPVKKMSAWAGVEASRLAPHVRADFAKTIAKEKKVDGHWLNVRPDPVDFRDKPYVAGLVEIKSILDPPTLTSGLVRQQGGEGSCTGHALAAAIDAQGRRRRDDLRAKGMTSAQIDALVPERVSARMLYEMARSYDEYPEDGLPGSSVRGAIKAFFHNGVCSEELAPYIDGAKDWHLSVERAKDARKTSLGSYFRLRHVLYDYHAALCEVGSVYVSAIVHEGWIEPKEGRIVLAERDRRKIIGAHAFAIVGYDADGFFVLNSWGPEWGGQRPGVAHWSYEDWQEHVLDAWVLRLAVPSAKTFHAIGGRQTRITSASGRLVSIPRIEVNGHYIHVKDGRYVTNGHYWNDRNSFEETAKRIEEPAPGQTKYKHLLFYAHGGLNDVDDAVERAHRLIPVLKNLEIYPVFFIWRTGFLEELTDVIRGQEERAIERTAGISDLSDRFFEVSLRPVGRLIWGEMKDDAADAMVSGSGANPVGKGWEATEILISAALRAGMKLHFAGHSAGAILLGQLLKRAKAAQVKLRDRLGSVSLFAPACTHQFFVDAYASLRSVAHDPDFAIYNLSDRFERDDNVGLLYRKSLLYLVSNSFEEGEQVPLAGFEAVARAITAEDSSIRLHLADGSPRAVTQSREHSGFDEDPATMNHMLNRILGEPQGTIGPGKRGFDQSILSPS
jgi:hypothetical protein